MTLLADFVTNRSVPFRQLRDMVRRTGIIESVYGAADLAVSQRAAGANMSVDVAVGDGWVNIDTGTRNGIVRVNNDAVANAPIGSNASGNPRIDQIVVQYNDSSIPAGVGGDTPTIRVVAGTPTAGATLVNRLGAASLPSDALRLADVVVANGAVSIVNANIGDRRALAFGQRAGKRGTGTSARINSSTAQLVTDMTFTGEFGGRPVLLDMSGVWRVDVGSASPLFAFYRDGVSIGNGWSWFSGTSNFDYMDGWTEIDTPAAGQHTYEFRAFAGVGTNLTFTSLWREFRVVELPTFG